MIFSADRLRTTVLCILTVFALTAVALADSVPDHDGGRLVVIGENGDHATVTLDGSRLHVVTVEDGDVAVHEFDFTLLGEIFDDAFGAALEGVDEALDALEDQDLNISFCDDHDDYDDDAELKAEIDELRAEIERLRDDLKKLR